MNSHISDYNYLMNLMQEIEMWNILLSLLDAETFDNFFKAFPILKLYCDYSTNYNYFGSLTISEGFLEFTSITGLDHINMKNCTIPIYENKINSNMSRLEINTKTFLLLKKNLIYLISNKKNILRSIQIKSVNRLTSYTASTRAELMCDKALINIIRKYKNLTNKILFENFICSKKCGNKNCKLMTFF